MGGLGPHPTYQALTLHTALRAPSLVFLGKPVCWPPIGATSPGLSSRGGLHCLLFWHPGMGISEPAPSSFLRLPRSVRANLSTCNKLPGIQDRQLLASGPHAQEQGVLTAGLPLFPQTPCPEGDPSMRAKACWTQPREGVQTLVPRGILLYRKHPQVSRLQAGWESTHASIRPHCLVWVNDENSYCLKER